MSDREKTYEVGDDTPYAYCRLAIDDGDSDSGTPVRRLSSVEKAVEHSLRL